MSPLHANDVPPHLPKPNPARNLDLLLAKGRLLPELTRMIMKRSTMNMNDDPLGPASAAEAVVAADVVLHPNEDLPLGAEMWSPTDDHDDQVPLKVRLPLWAEDGQLLLV